MHLKVDSDLFYNFFENLKNTIFGNNFLYYVYSLVFNIFRYKYD